MDLAFLIPSKVRRVVLQYFMENPKARVCIRELARQISLSPQLVYRELLNLEGWGLLFSSKQANQRIFYLNQKFPLYPAISEIFRRTGEENNRPHEINKVLDWNKLASEYKKIPISSQMISGLTAPRKRPRAYEEEKILRRKGLL